MKIAIYHNEDIHFEMLGYLLEYCYSYNVEPHVYSKYKTGTHIGDTYSRWYDRFFNHPIEWKTDNILTSNIDYDIVFLVTDDNPNFTYPIKDKYGDKTISIEHWYNSRNEIKNKVATRLFFNRTEIPYATPCYNIISVKEKFEILQMKTRLQVVFVGRFNFPSSFTLAFFNHFEDIDFHVIIWNMKSSYVQFLKEVPNLHIHIEIEAEEMMNIMKGSHYVFFNPSYIEGYVAHKTSATLHLALSTLVKPIIPKQWNAHYKLDSNLAIEYDDLDYLRPDKQLNLSFDDYFQSLKFIGAQRRNEIANRNIIFDNMIQSITGTIPPSLKSSCVTQFFDRLNLIDYPKVFVGIESCYDDKIISDFREVHMVNTVSTDIVLGNHVYNYTGENTTDLVSNVINVFIEPVVFFIEENSIEGSVYYNRLLNILFTRNFDDIFVFNFVVRDIDIPLIRNYSIYRFGIDEPFTILVPKQSMIPNILFQFCLGNYYKNIDRIPVKIFENIKQTAPEYEYILYTDPKISNIADHFNPILNRQYNSLSIVNKTDLLRMELLYNRGGIYMDLDYEPLSSISNTFRINELKPTFVTVIPTDSNNGLCIGLLGCTKYNKIMSMILGSINQIDIENATRENGMLFCIIVAHILKQFMGVDQLREGFYEVKGERILLLSELFNMNEHKFEVRYKGELLGNTRYADYPWTLNDTIVDSFSVSNDIIQNNNTQYRTLYINLAYREDRKEQIENELKNIEITNFKRFDAIKNIGNLGCSKSHLECIKMARDNQYPNVIIFEDDFQFVIGKDEFHNLLNNLLTVDYDVCLLSYNTMNYNISNTDHPLLRRIKKSQTASGYIVNQKYYDKLISNSEEGLRLLLENNIPDYWNDKYWNRLQNTDKCFCYKKRVGIQRESYSDIENKIVNYEV